MSDSQLKTYLTYLRDLDVVIESASDVLRMETDDPDRVDAWDNHPADAVRTSAQEELERIHGEVHAVLDPIDLTLEWCKTRRAYVIIPR